TGGRRWRRRSAAGGCSPPGSRMNLAVVDGRVDGTDPEREVIANGVEATVAERVAAQDAPAGQHQTTTRAKEPYGLGGVAGTARLIATALRQRGREPASVRGYEGQQQAFHVERFLPEPASASSMLAVTPLEPSRSIRSPISGLATMTKSCWGGSWS